MPTIYLETVIDAPIEHCFNLGRSIDLHVDSLSHTREKAIAGKTSGLIELGEWVTWKAWHFGIPLKMTVKITKMKPPYSFTDEQIKGPFKYLKHIHTFKQEGEGTIMIDEFSFQSPFGIIGRFVDKVILTNYMKKLLVRRNKLIRFEAEKKVYLDSFDKSNNDITIFDTKIGALRSLHYYLYLVEDSQRLTIDFPITLEPFEIRSLVELFEKHLNAVPVKYFFNTCIIKINNHEYKLITGYFNEGMLHATNRDSIRYIKTITKEISDALLHY